MFAYIKYHKSFSNGSHVKIYTLNCPQNNAGHCGDIDDLEVTELNGRISRRNYADVRCLTPKEFSSYNRSGLFRLSEWTEQTLGSK